MWNTNSYSEGNQHSFEGGSITTTAVAIDKDKNSQFAVKWAIEKLKLKDNQIILVHVRTHHPADNCSYQDVPKEGREPTPAEMQQLFLPYRSICARKGIRAKEVILHGVEVAKALSDCITATSISTIVLGASSRGALVRAFKGTDVPSTLVTCAPESCAVYVVSKGRVLKLKSSTHPHALNSATSSIPRPDTTTQTPKFHPQESWKTAASELSCSDGDNQQKVFLAGSNHTSPQNSMNDCREQWQMTSRERISGIKTPSPQNSVTSNEFGSRETTFGINSPSPINAMNSNELGSRERMLGIKSPSPQNSESSNAFLQAVRAAGQYGNSHAPVESANTSYESIAFGSNYSTSHDSGAGDSEFGHTTLPNRQPSSNISAMLQPVTNLNLQAQTKERLPYSASGSSDQSDTLSFPSDVSFEILDQPQFSDSSKNSSSSLASEIEDELRRLKQELKQITVKYNAACQEAATARDKVRGIVQNSEENKLEDAKHIQEAAMAIVEKEKLKCKAAIEAAQKAQRIAELESEKRKHAEMKYKQEVDEKQKTIDALTYSEIRYRRYTKNEIEVATNYFSIEEKIGEGGYGPVFKATLDHTPVAIKVLRPDMSQGEKQFHREVEVLSHMRHPNMVILMGACPEYGCLVYEYMENGSLEDRLFCKNGTRPLPWTTRFRIAAEIATALNFLHRTRPEPLVHRDLKPANILLDRNYVSKISDVGLCRLVPPSVADSVTEYHMTAAAGTFCYIDPEYQQTGMLGTKSDIYSLGVMLLQIITAKPPMGLTHQVETAIETGRFAGILDPTVKNWPVDEALSFAKMALKCCELRRKDRPDLDSVILPELQRLRDLESQDKPDGRSYHRRSQI